MVEAFFTAAFQLRKRSPWSEFAENEVFGIRLNGIFRFVVILGKSL